MAAWKQTLEEMNAIADDRREDGWEVLEVMAAHTDTVSIDMREHDDFGLFHIIPNNHAEEFEAMFDPAKFTEFLVYGAAVEGFMYVVIEWIDPAEQRSILLCCRYDMVHADGMIESAASEGVLYSHVKTIDGTVLGVFEYDDYEPLISHPAEQTDS